MTPPIRLSPPRIGASLDLTSTETSPLVAPLFPRFTMTPWVPGSIPFFRLPSIFGTHAIASSTSAPTPLSFVDFLPALYDLADGIESMDVDLENVPVNRSSGLCRYSEYTPRDVRPRPVEDCSLTVYPNTTARVHGEIRPIRGTGESLITRFLVDFNPDVFNAAPINNLRVDGFGAVDAPDITFDQTFHTRMPVLSMSGGDLNYENPFATHSPLASPFGQEAPPPPHRDFMIRFATVEPTVLSVVQREAGAPRLLLWAFLPTLGISEPSMFEDLGIRFNTMPRRFGDLLRLFSPLFDSARGSALRQAAPYLNPNSEILLDPEELQELNAERSTRHEAPLVGLRQALPVDRAENIRWYERRQSLNTRRAAQGLPPLPAVTTNRGPVIDWIFTDLARDPERLATIPDAELPSLSARARLRATRLTLPMGTVTLNAGAEIHVGYTLERVTNPPAGQSPVQMALEVRIEPVDIASLDLNTGSAHVTADHLGASRLEFRMHSPIMLDRSATSPGSEMEITLTGVEAENLELGSPELGFSAHLNSAHLSSLSFHRSPSEGIRTEVHGLETEGVHITHTSMNLDLASLSVPSLNLERGLNEDGSPGPLRIHVPSLGIEGIEGSGRVPVHGGSFHLENGVIELQRGHTVFEGQLDLRGNFPNGFSDGPIAMDTLTVQPAVEDLRVQGRARIELRPDGFRLSRSEGADPLNIGFRIGASSLEHHPALLPSYLRGRPVSEIIQTHVDLQSAEVRVEDLREVELVRTETPEGRRNQIRQLQCGPISVHHITASGRIWVGLPIWGYVRGFFPVLGGGLPATSARQPDLSSLLQHLPQEARDLLGSGDFFRIGGVNLHRDADGAWQTRLGDVTLALRETGGRRQYAGIWIPNFTFGLRSAEPGHLPSLLEPTDFWINSFLNDPDRGGSFRFFRWFERP